MNENKKSNPIVLLLCAIFCAALAVSLVYVDKDIITGNATDFWRLEGKDGVSKGDYVEVDVDYVLGNYASTKHTVNYVIPTGTDEHYLIWLDDDSLISLSVGSKKEKEILEDLTEQTWAYIEEETDKVPDRVTFKGKVSSLDTDILRYMREALEQVGATEVGLEVRYLEIDCTTTSLDAIIMVVVIAVISVVLFVASIAGFKNNKKLKEEERAMQADSYDSFNQYDQAAQADSDSDNE